MPFVSTSWQEADEVTSAKLQQMSANDDYFNENMIHGNLNFLAGTGSVAPGSRTIGAVTGLRLEAVRYHFDSITTFQVYVLQIPIPPVFTVPPVVVFSHQVVSYFTIVHGTEPDRNDYMEFYMVEKDQQYVRFQGEISALLFGA